MKLTYAYDPAGDITDLIYLIDPAHMIDAPANTWHTYVGADLIIPEFGMIKSLDYIDMLIDQNVRQVVTELYFLIDEKNLVLHGPFICKNARDSYMKSVESQLTPVSRFEFANCGVSETVQIDMILKIIKCGATTDSHIDEPLPY